MRRKFYLMIAGILLIPQLILAQGNPSSGTAPADAVVNPDNFFSFIALGMMLIFILLIIVALSRAVSAMSKTLQEKYKSNA